MFWQNVSFDSFMVDMDCFEKYFWDLINFLDLNSIGQTPGMAIFSIEQSSIWSFGGSLLIIAEEIIIEEEIGALAVLLKIVAYRGNWYLEVTTSRIIWGQKGVSEWNWNTNKSMIWYLTWLIFIDFIFWPPEVFDIWRSRPPGSSFFFSGFMCLFQLISLRFLKQKMHKPLFHRDYKLK